MIKYLHVIKFRHLDNPIRYRNIVPVFAEYNNNNHNLIIIVFAKDWWIWLLSDLQTQPGVWKMRKEILVLVIILTMMTFATIPVMAKDDKSSNAILKDNGNGDSDKVNVGHGDSDKNTQNNGQGFDELWKAISDLRTQIENIQLIPGPQGPQGPPGPAGTCSCGDLVSQVDALNARVLALEGGTGQEPVCNPGSLCDTGFIGTCGAGTMSCSNGIGTCIQTQPAIPEVCDGRDNDCDGLIDNGQLCGEGQDCYSGMCRSV